MSPSPAPATRDRDGDHLISRTRLSDADSLVSVECDLLDQVGLALRNTAEPYVRCARPRSGCCPPLAHGRGDDALRDRR